MVPVGNLEMNRVQCDMINLGETFMAFVSLLLSDHSSTDFWRKQYNFKIHQTHLKS